MNAAKELYDRFGCDGVMVIVNYENTTKVGCYGFYSHQDELNAACIAIESILGKARKDEDEPKADKI